MWTETWDMCGSLLLSRSSESKEAPTETELSQHDFEAHKISTFPVRGIIKKEIHKVQNLEALAGSVGEAAKSREKGVPGKGNRKN